MSQKMAPPPSTPYGAPILLEASKKAMAAAEAEANKNNWGVAIAIVDSGGNLVMLQRLDNAQLSAVRIAEAKARTAVEFRLRPRRWKTRWREVASACACWPSAPASPKVVCQSSQAAVSLAG
jgi:uncharacterized protein GlcG (DUF336 family)